MARIEPFDFTCDNGKVTGVAFDEKLKQYTVNVQRFSDAEYILRLQLASTLGGVDRKPLTKWQRLRRKIHNLSRYRLRWVNIDDYD